jgi:RNA polymerase sigma factor (sigma-70 family)
VETLADRLGDDLEAAFPCLVDSYQGAVYTTALRLSPCPADAADLAAETFLRAYSALRGWPAERIRQLQPRAWLLTIVLNLCRNAARTAGRRPDSVALDGTAPPPAPGTPEDTVASRDASDRLLALVATLPDAQRAAVVLRHVVGLSSTEMAEVLGCPENTAKSHLRRGLDRLRALLPEEDQ